MTGDPNRKESIEDERGVLRIRVWRFPAIKRVRVQTQDECAKVDSKLETRNCGESTVRLPEGT